MTAFFLILAIENLEFDFIRAKIISDVADFCSKNRALAVPCERVANTVSDVLAT